MVSEQEGHLRCKKCTEKVVDKNDTAKPLVATSTATVVMVGSNTTTVNIPTRAPTSIKPKTPSSKAQNKDQRKESKAKPETDQTPKKAAGKQAQKGTHEDETGDGTGAVNTGPSKTDGEKLADLYTKHSIPIFPAGIEYDQFLDLKKLFSLQSYSSIAQQNKMSMADLHFALTDRYGNIVILY